MSFQDFPEEDVNMLLDIINNIKKKDLENNGGIISLSIEVKSKTHNIISFYGNEQTILNSLLGIFFTLRKEKYDIFDLLEKLTKILKDDRFKPEGEEAGEDIYKRIF